MFLRLGTALLILIGSVFVAHSSTFPLRKEWRYTPREGDNDSSVSGWGAKHLKSSEVAEPDFLRDAYFAVIAWYDKVTERARFPH